MATGRRSQQSDIGSGTEGRGSQAVIEGDMLAGLVRVLDLPAALVIVVMPGVVPMEDGMREVIGRRQPCRLTDEGQ